MMANILFNDFIVEQAGSVEMALCVFVLLFCGMAVSLATAFSFKERPKQRYIVSKEFLKIEDRTKKDLTKLSGTINTDHCYFDGIELFVKK
ncbi:MAG: hypothetical protein IKL08_00925 [Clostridia bacterium]|nr:hypothetical protein [Clostridia bacterium]